MLNDSIKSPEDVDIEETPPNNKRQDVSQRRENPFSNEKGAVDMHGERLSDYQDGQTPEGGNIGQDQLPSS